MFKILYSSFLLLFSCQNNELVLVRCDPKEWDAIDTIEQNGNIVTLQLIDQGFMDDFSIEYAICKKSGSCYRISNESDRQIRFSKDYIAYSDDGGRFNWGWFHLKDGRIMDTLPEMRRILDSIANEFPNNRYFLRVANGYIEVLDNGNLVTTFGYGDLFLDKSITNFDSLEYGIYQLNERSVRKISNNVDLFYLQADGVYFIPRPGYGVTARFDTKRVYAVIDTVSTLKLMPRMLKFEPLK